MPKVGVSEEGVCCKIISIQSSKSENRHEAFILLLQSIFSVLETVVCQKFIHVYA